MRVLASGLRFPEGPVVLDDGAVLVSEMAAGRVTRVDPTGTTTTLAEVSGGPNGLLRRDSNDVVVCQSGGSTWGVAPWPYAWPGAPNIFRPTGGAEHPAVPSLQVVDANGVVSTLATRFTALDGSVRDLVRPSDICTDGAGGFYLTDGGTSHGRTRQLTGLLHCARDGEPREIVFPLEMPNGVATSPDGRLVYVAETRTRRVWRFETSAPGVVSSAAGFVTVPSGGPLNIGGADGICVDESGCVVVATLGTGGVTVFAPDGRLVLQLPLDDPMTTNAAVDPVGDRLLVTLASSGRLVAIEGWRSQLAAALRR